GPCGPRRLIFRSSGETCEVSPLTESWDVKQDCRVINYKCSQYARGRAGSSAVLEIAIMKTLMRLTWHILALTVVVLVIALLAVLSLPAAPRANAALGLSQKVHLYYYAWYGNPSFNGSWQHWNQSGHAPPN